MNFEARILKILLSLKKECIVLYLKVDHLAMPIALAVPLEKTAKEHLALNCGQNRSKH